MRISSLAAIVGLMAMASASSAQIGTVSTTGYNGWTSFSGCHVGVVPVTLPGGFVYYTGGTAPYLGASMLGVCGYDLGNVVPTGSTTTGWVGFVPPPPQLGSWGSSSSETLTDIIADLNDGAGQVYALKDEDPKDNDPKDQDPKDPKDPKDHGPTDDGPIVVPGVPVSATPEPASLMLVASGLVGLAGVAWRRRRQ